LSTAFELLAGTLRGLAGGVDVRADALRVRGSVERVGDGVAAVVGLGTVGYEELLAFDSGALGLAYDLDTSEVGVILLSGAHAVRASEGVERLRRSASLPVGDALLGRAVDPLGHPIDDGPALAGDAWPVFGEAPKLLERAPVERSLHTGVMVVDAAIPIGRGQRQLIVGDRNVGKSALALDIVAAQRGSDVLCVYVVIGQPMSRIIALRETLASTGAFEHTVVVAADAGSPPGLQYLAPYSGATVGDAFRAAGKDVLIVYDDLTKHADAYRELALLLGRSPGREAFPGDIFFIHAELLERASAMSPEEGGGSVTAFPLIETTDGDISAYIPTNLISITDGQIYLDTIRFERNQRPAVDIGRSVSRIGGIAQVPVLRKVAMNLRIQMSRFESLESLTRVGLDIDPATRRTVERGQIAREILRQGRFAARTVAEQVIPLVALSEGWLDGLQPAAARQLLLAAIEGARTSEAAIVQTLDRGEEPTEGWREALHAVVEQASKVAR
jgi:F-type H+-transporting ATPase subunit alpha